MLFTDKLQQATFLAAGMMSEHGLGDWHLRRKPVTSYAAQTTHRDTTITISTRFVTIATKAEFIGVMYHEIAHALVGVQNGHNEMFKAKYYELTGKHDYSGYASVFNIKKYLTECPECGTIGTRNSMEPRFCRSCSTQKKEKILVKIYENPLELAKW
jgi:hypothetical protein